MGLLLWIVFGAIAGWLASVIMKGSGQGLLSDIFLGILGAIVGGFLVSLFGGQGVTGFNLSSFFVAIIGAIIVVWLGRTLRRA